MSDDLRIGITAQDQASPVFTRVATAARTLAEALEEAGKEGAQSFKQAGESAEQSASKFQKAQQQATLLGGAIGTVGSAFALLGNAARDQERLTDAIGRAYGDAGDEMLEFSNKMQDTTRYSNDAVQSSLLLANSLQQNYGLSTDSIQQLTMRAADMAQIFGIELPDAMSRLSGAIRGEGEAAEALGLNLSDAAVSAEAAKRGLEGWNTGAISDAEKAAFRYQLVMEQSAFAAGAAAEAGESAGGKFRQIANDFQDAAAGVGSFLGPIGSVAAELAPIAVALPLVGAGVGKLGTALKAATGATTGLGAATSVLGLAFNPVTLGIGALVLGGIALYESWNKGKEEAEAFAASLGSLADAIELARRRGDSGLADQGQEIYDLIGDIGDLEKELAKLNDLKTSPEFVFPDPATIDAATAAVEAQESAISQLQDTAGLTGPVIDKLTEAMSDPNINVDAYFAWVEGVIAAAAATDDAADDVEALQKIMARPLSDFAIKVDTTQLEAATASMEDFLAVTEGVFGQSLDLQLGGMDSAANDVLALADAFGQLQTIGTTVVDGAMGGLIISTELTAEGLQKATKAYDALNEALASGNYDNARLMAAYLQAIADADSPDEAAENTFELAKNIEIFEKAASSAHDITLRSADGLDIYEYSAKRAEEAQAQLNDTVKAFAQSNPLEFIDQITQGVRDAGGGALAENSYQNIFRSLDISQEVAKAGEALDTILGYYEVIDSLGQRSSGSNSIAENLVGAAGEWAIVDDLLANSRISLDQYNKTLEAGYAIQESNLQVQEDLNVIRANQLPLLAEQQSAYETTINQLAAMGPLEQQQALYLMDSGNAAKVSSAFMTAYSASMGEIPESVATSLIVDVAKADPVLADVLETMGLIEEDPVTGEVRVNFPDAESVQDAIGDVNRTIGDLIDLLDNGALDKTYTVKVRVELDAHGITGNDSKIGGGNLGSLLQLPELAPIEQPVKMLATVDDQATEPLNQIKALRDGLDGTSATVEIKGDPTDAGESINDIGRALDDLDGDIATVIQKGNPNDAQNAIRDVDRALSNLDGNIATVKLNANRSNAEQGISWARAYDGDTLATSYINIVTRYFDSGSDAHYQQNGGIVGLATGGMVPFWGAEAGPELAHFATGGSAWLPSMDLYTAPAGTYVSPAPAAASAMGPSVSISIPIYGNVYGMDDLEDQVAARMGPALVEVIQEHYRGQGIFT